MTISKERALEALGDLYGAYCGANVVSVDALRDVVRDFIEQQAARIAELEQQHEREVLELIDDRDAKEAMADKLASAIAERFGIDIGEHSSGNCPWRNALEVVQSSGAQGARQGIPYGTALIPLDTRYSSAHTPLVTNRMKSACMGEFAFTIEAPEISEDGDLTGETIDQVVTVPWDMVKKIYKRMASEAYLAAPWASEPAHPAPAQQPAVPVATIHDDGHWTHPPGSDPLDQFSGKRRMDVFAGPQPVVPEGWRETIALAAGHLGDWLDAQECDCEMGHICGRPNVERTRQRLLDLLSAQQPAQVAHWPRVLGVSRVLDNGLSVLVSFADVPTDDHLRALHDNLRAQAADREGQPS